MTAAMTGLMLRSPTILKYSSGWAGIFMTLPGSFFCIYKMYSIPYAPQNQGEKKAYWLGFNSLMAFSLVPLVYAAEMLVIRDAFLITSGCFAGLGLITKNSRDDAFLGMSGFLGAGLGAITALSLANIFLQTNALFNIWLYGGLALFLGFTLYDMKTVQVRAQRSAHFDPMTQSLGVYLDFLNIFIRLVYILQGKKNKK
jgi:FtsH-binding integral membrane protein